jgi:hypothetical protein
MQRHIENLINIEAPSWPPHYLETHYSHHYEEFIVESDKLNGIAIMAKRALYVGSQHHAFVSTYIRMQEYLKDVVNQMRTLMYPFRGRPINLAQLRVALYTRQDLIYRLRALLRSEPLVVGMCQALLDDYNQIALDYQDVLHPNMERLSHDLTELQQFTLSRPIGDIFLVRTLPSYSQLGDLF